MRYRKRASVLAPIPATSLKVVYKWSHGGTLTVHDGPAIAGYSGFSTEGILDELHQKVGSKWKSGGPMDLVRHEVHVSPVSVFHIGGDWQSSWLEATGTIYPIFVSGSDQYTIGNDNLPQSGMPAAMGYGAQAWNKFKPARPTANLTEWAAELRELPRLLMRRNEELLNAGSNYLAYQFGWKPFLNDLVNMIQTSTDLDKSIRTLRQNNDKWLLRTGSIKSDTGVSRRWSDGSYSPCFTPWGPQDVFDHSQYRAEGYSIESERVWFSGRFKYYIKGLSGEPGPQGMDPKLRLTIRNRLLGVNLTPAVVWELMPWSWLIDYFTNVGDVLDNLSTGVADDLVASYAYVMRHRITEEFQTSHGKFTNHLWNIGPRFSGSIYRRVESKARASADPFGFNMSGDLSARQLAILAALGHSRG